jgi:hypothetical protein
VAGIHVTLLIEPLRRMATLVDPAIGYPALERLWSRGDECLLVCPTANHLRFALFGIEPGADLPVAALTHVNDRRASAANDYYWLRVDPVSMWADMARVFMTSYGFADLDAYERNEIEICIRDVLREEGIDLHAEHPERWCIALSRPLEFCFTPLEEALGMNVAEALPDHPEARYWRRILNEIQVALHNCPVNVRRRAGGKPQVNSVWFWGGGFIPEAAPHDLMDTVFSDNAVSRGLAIINDCSIQEQSSAVLADLNGAGRSILIDWTPGLGDAQDEMALLESLVGSLLDRVDRGQMELTVYDGSGRGWTYGPGSRRRFWRRRKRSALMFAQRSET